MHRWTILDAMPSGYCVEDERDGVLVVREEFLSAFHEAGFRAGSGEPDRTSDLAGRKPLGELRMSEQRFVVRRFHHGGMLRWVTGHRFADPQRPFRELSLSVRLRELGVATPEVIAARARRAAVGGWILDLVTRRVEEARDLAEWLEALREGGVGSTERRATIERVGAFVGRFHGLGLWHADLNPRNLLLDSGEDGPGVQVLDLDRSVLSPDLGPAERRANLARLLRAVLRREGRGAPFLQAGDLGRFLRGYLAGAGDATASFAEEWRSVAEVHARSASTHRLWWRVEQALGGGPGHRDGKAVVRQKN